MVNTLLTIDNPQLLNMNEVVENSLLEGEGAHWYKVELTGNVKYQFKTGPGDNHPLEDTVLILMDKNKAELAFNDDINDTNFYSCIEFDIKNTGTYYLYVSGYDSSEGAYNISYSEFDEGPEPEPAALTVPVTMHWISGDRDQDILIEFFKLDGAINNGTPPPEDSIESLALFYWDDIKEDRSFNLVPGHYMIYGTDEPVDEEGNGAWWAK